MRRFLICLTLILVIPGLMFTLSCTTKNSVVPSGMEKVMAQPELEPNEDDCREKPVAAKEPEMVAVVDEEFNNEDVLFGYDSSELTAYAQEVLKQKVEWMNENPDKSVTIEGHCDERGTNEYNLALGDRRAQSAKTFLVDMGISAERISIISYGEEHPVDLGHIEEAWTKNRRAHFVFE